MGATRLAYEVEGWGTGELWAADGHRVQSVDPAHRRDRVGSVTIAELAARVCAYFAGDPVRFDDVDLDLDWCTPFQRSVADVLRSVPAGQTVTYGELAALAGHPNAQRAAGTFCAGNRFGLLVPCHRVFAADGLGSYGSFGVEYKRRLLQLENAL